ncbi:hypothetical protein LBMAG42_10120 [Deltaproteobacteria bacterium]|nr:hypothetical protein LBMAG42_10120 [Deltaproteobacteria bacterium]
MPRPPAHLLGLLILVALLTVAPFLTGTLATGDMLVFFPTLYQPVGTTWIDGVMCGTPWLANPQTAAYYPPAWLLGWNYWRWLPLYLAGHVFWGGLGTWLWVRATRLSGSGALLAAVAWMVCGPTFSLFTKLDKLPGHAWLPWVLLGATLPRGAALVAVGIASIWLGGSVEGLVIALAAGGAWAALTGGRARVATTLLGIAVGLLIACATLVPALRLLASTTRAGGLEPEAAMDFSLPTSRWPYVLVPGPVDGRAWLGSLYAGAAAAVLGMLGLRDRRAWVPALGVVGFAALAMGSQNPLYPYLLKLPGFGSIQFPEKWWLGTVPFATLLAAAGWDRLQLRLPAWAVFVAAATMTADGLRGGYRITPMVPRESVTAPSEIVDAIHRTWRGSEAPRTWDLSAFDEEDPALAAGVSEVEDAEARLHPNLGALHDITHAWGSWPLRASRTQNFFAHVLRQPAGAQHRLVRDWVGANYWVVWGSGKVPRLVDEAGLVPLVDLAEHSLRSTVLAEPRPAERARWVGKVVRIGDRKEAVFALATQNATLIDGDPGTEGWDAGGEAAEAPLSIVHDGPGAWRFRYDTVHDGAIVLLQAWAPEWEQRVDDGEWTEAPLLDYFLVGARAPAGDHVIELRYTPAGRGLGLVLSALGLAALSALAVWARRGAAADGVTPPG